MNIQDFPDPHVLEQKFTQTDFLKFCYNVGAIEAAGQTGLPYMDICTVYDRTQKNLPELLAAHAKRVGQNAAAPPKGGRSDGFVGRTEFAILLEELHRQPVFQKIYQSPLAMIVAFIKLAQEPHLLDPNKQAEEARIAAEQAAAKKKKSGWK